MATPRQASPREVEENKRKQAYLKSRGYNVPVDGSWGPWQEQAWVKATTRQKQYPVSPLGLLQRGWDNLTGNTTYRVEHPEGEIRQAPVKSNTSLAGAIAIGARDPRAILAAVPLAVGSSLLLGNGPEIMQSVSGAGRELKEGAKRTYNRLASYFYPEDAPDPTQSGGGTSSGGSAPAQPAPTPTPAPAQPAQGGTASGRSTAPANPNPGDNNPRRGRVRRALDALRGRDASSGNTGGTTNGTTPTPEPKPSRGLAPFTGYSNGTWYGNAIRFGRDWQTVGSGLDLIDNIAGGIGERLDTTRVNNSNWNLTRNYTPAGFLFHLSTKPAPIRPDIPTNTTTSQTTTTSTEPSFIQSVAPTDTLTNIFD